MRKELHEEVDHVQLFWKKNHHTCSKWYDQDKVVCYYSNSNWNWNNRTYETRERCLLPMRASIPSRSKGMKNRILLQANVQGVVLCAMIQRQTANGKRFLHNIPFFLGRKFSSHYSHLYQVMQSKTFTKTITSCDVCNRKCIMLDSIDFAMSIPTLNIKMQLATLL